MYRTPDPVPVNLKITLSAAEASALTGIGIAKINSLLQDPRCPFVLFVGQKRLVKREKFQKYLMDNLVI